MNLVIVESPTKSTTIKNYLGSGYKVMASVGHVRDLPKSTLGIDVDNGFAPHYINIRGKGDLIKQLKKEVKKADKVFLAPDPDREGEAISWHLVTALEIPPEKVRRVTFNEVTKSVVKDSIKHPRDIDMDLVNAQQARRILDRIVGYKLSPFLWKNIKSGLSAGRVQSVVTRLIVEREEEIRAFVPKEYWNIDAEVESSDGTPFTVHYFAEKGDAKKHDVVNGDEAKMIASDVSDNRFTVSDVKKSKKYRAPAPPFTTSTLQQEASRKLNFQTHRTMKVAQELYEGINLGSANGGMQGLITYMRTDSLRVSRDAQEAAKAYITEHFGAKYYPKTTRVYKSKANAQDAHEAIRPANVNLEPQKVKNFLSSDQFKLYQLIWARFVASQMQSAELSVVSVELECEGHTFKTAGSTVKFAGFLSLYEESTDEAEQKNDKNKLPEIKSGERLACLNSEAIQHFTEPPARYNEASLVKLLEEKGIGRPSTYNTIITIVLSRGYVNRDGKSLVPTVLGEVTTKLMKDSFPDIVDYTYTAQMEEKLDDIENGKETLENTLHSFYDGFSKELSDAEKNVDSSKYKIPVEETDLTCDLCGAKMVVKEGRFGKFAACPNYPKCKGTKQLPKRETAKSDADEISSPQIAGFKCEKCGSDMVVRTGQYGEFYACVRYPECKFTKAKAEKLEGVVCPECGGDILIKRSKSKNFFYSCANYPKCDFSSWDMPTAEKCPECSSVLFKKKAKGISVCKKCNYEKKD